jgi:hypothetical protein
VLIVLELLEQAADFIEIAGVIATSYGRRTVTFPRSP